MGWMGWKSLYAPHLYEHQYYNTLIIPRFPRPSQTCSPLLAPLYDTIGNILEIHWKYIPCMTQFDIYYDWKLGVQLVFDMAVG